jgi:hypothetical protein
MLISEKSLKKLILHKMSEKQKIAEAKEDRQYRKKMRKQRRAEIKAASTPEEKKAIRKKYKEDRKEMRDADKFEISDEGPSLDALISDESTGDSVYDYVVSRINAIMPDINKIDQKYKGVLLVKMLKSRREKRFTIGQVKRFIKDGLLATQEKDYRLAADKFCAAYVFLETPKTPDRQVINVSTETMDVLYELCKEFDGIISDRGGQTKPGSKKPGGKTGSNTDCVKDIQETLNALNATTPEVEQLAVDGKWGPKTSKAWNIACKANIEIGMQINGVDITENIVGDILRDWLTAAPQLNYDADPCGARDFLGDVLKLRQEDPTPPPPPPVDPDWGKRRSKEVKKAELDLEKLLTTDGGLSIDYVYTVDEFSTEYGSDDIESLITMGGTSSTNILRSKTYDVERYPAGPDGNSTFSTALYYDQSRSVLVVDKVGDAAIRDIVLVGDKLYQKSLAPVSETIITNGDDVLLNEKSLRKLIRKQLLNEEKGGLNVDDIRRLMGEIQGTLTKMQEDEGVDVENAFGKLGRATSSFMAGNSDEAKKMFLTAADQLEQAGLGSATTKERENAVGIIRVIANNVGSPEVKDAVEQIDKIAKKKGGETKKASKKAGKKSHSKVKRMQVLMNYINANSDKSDLKLKEDGIWGSKTTKAWHGVLIAMTERGIYNLTEKDVKLKWSVLSKKLGNYTPDQGGILQFLTDMGVHINKDEGAGEDKLTSKKEGPSIYEVNGRKFDRDYEGRSLGGGAMMVNLLKFPIAKLWGGGKKSTSPASLETYSSLKDFIDKKPKGNNIIKVGRTEPGRTDKDKIETITVATLPSASAIGQQTVLVLKDNRLIIDGIKLSNYSIYGYKKEGDFVVYTGE